jgi:hypothetical protein
MKKGLSAYLACSGLPLFFSETLGENKDVSKGITDVKLFEAPGLHLDLKRSNHIDCQVFLVQRSILLTLIQNAPRPVGGS